MTEDSLLELALNLPLSKRAKLVASLIESLDADQADADVADAWGAEVARRVAELDAGEVSTIPWSEVRSRLFCR